MLQSPRAVAPSNMEFMSVTLPVSKANCWSKALAALNMPLMVVTLLTSKTSGWLKDVAA